MHGAHHTICNKGGTYRKQYREPKCGKTTFIKRITQCAERVTRTLDNTGYHLWQE